jgi:peroxiredoxin Q/BCP
MARPRSSGKLRSASRSRKSRVSKAKRKKTASRRKAVKRARPKQRPRSKPRARAGRKVRPKPKARPKSKARTKAKARPKPPAEAKARPKAKAGARGPARTARGAERQGALEFEMEAHGPEVSIERHPAPPPAPRRRGGRGSPNSADYPGESLTVGMEAPEFALPSTLNRSVTLSEFRGRRVVLYFYPKDDTPGCTMEACAFRDAIPRIEAKGAVVLGISLDDELSHQRFAEKYNLNFPLLSDKDAAISRKYGTYKEKSLYGRSFWGIERTTFVIDREGKVEHVFRRVKVEGHAEEVMATLAV